MTTVSSPHTARRVSPKLQLGFAGVLAAFMTVPYTFLYCSFMLPYVFGVESVSGPLQPEISQTLLSVTLPVFTICWCMALWGLRQARRNNRIISWPFLLIVCWLVAAAGSTVSAYVIESSNSPLRLADMDYAVLTERVMMHSFILFVKNSLMLLCVGTVFVTIADRILSNELR